MLWLAVVLHLLLSGRLRSAPQRLQLRLQQLLLEVRLKSVREAVTAVKTPCSRITSSATELHLLQLLQLLLHLHLHLMLRLCVRRQGQRCR